MSSCPNPETLERFAYDFLDPESAGEVAAHVQACPTCRERVSAAAAEGLALASAMRPARISRPKATRNRARVIAWSSALGIAAVLALALGLGSGEEPSREKGIVLGMTSSSESSPQFHQASRPRHVAGYSERAPEGLLMKRGEVWDHSETPDDEEFSHMKGVDMTALGGRREPLHGARLGRAPDLRPAPSPTPAPEPDSGAPIAKDYGTNAWREAGKDHLSTFGMDVDTASYTMARRWLQEGRMPVPATVRVEEFVNAFKTHDAAPESEAFAIHLEAAPSPFAEGRLMLRICAKTRVLKPSQRPPCVLTFVIDCSGSMNQANRLPLAKTALLELVDHLGEGDRVGIVIFDDQSRTVLPTTDNREKMRDAIRALQPGGSTNAEAGLLTGFQVAAAALVEGQTNRVLLCSDGVANVGRTGPEEILKVIAREREKGIRLSTVGFGMGGVNDHLMEQLANKGNGRYHYVDDLAEVRKVFGENLGATLEDVALDAKVQVEFDPAVVKRFRQLGYENRALAHRDFRNDAVDAGEVGPGHSVTALYELELADPDSPHRLAQVTLRYKEPATKEVCEKLQSISRPQAKAKFTEASLDFQLAATAGAFAEVLRKSEHARSLSLASVGRLAQRCSDLFDGTPEPKELLELVRLAEKIEGAGSR